MPQILNSRDRSQAFYKFLLFFIITTLLVIMAIYLNFRVPVKDNVYLQNQLDIQRTQDANQAKFVSKMEEAVFLLDSLDKPGANADQVQILLNAAIGDMNKLSPIDNTIYGRMDKALWSQFDQLRKAKKQLLEGKENAERIRTLESENRNCKTSLDQANRDLDFYRKNPQ